MKVKRSAKSSSAFTVALEDGLAEYVGEGMFLVRQREDGDTVTASFAEVFLTMPDIQAMMASSALTLELAQGVAENAGDDLWVIYQTEGDSPKQQGVVLSLTDLAGMCRVGGEPQALQDAVRHLDAATKRYTEAAQARYL